MAPPRKIWVVPVAVGLALAAAVTLRDLRPKPSPTAARPYTLSRDLVVEVPFGSDRRSVTFLQPPDSQSVRLTFSGEPNRDTLEVPLPSSQSMEFLHYELKPIDLGAGAPPTVDFSMSGGGDGLSRTFHFLFSAVDGRIRLTFRYESETDSYFNVSTCAYWKDGLLWEEKGPETGKAPGPGFQPIALEKFRLAWSPAENIFKKEKAAPETPWISLLTAELLHAEPSLNAKELEVDAHARLPVLGYRLCSPKENPPQCDPGLPAEMPRWYQVRLPDRSTAWLLTTEDSQYDSNVHCSL